MLRFAVRGRLAKKTEDGRIERVLKRGFFSTVGRKVSDGVVERRKG